MTARSHRLLGAAEAVLLLLPLTLLTVAILVLSYPAYPIPLRTLQVIFDLAMLAQVVAIIAGWRLMLGYLRHGPAGLARTHRGWLGVLAIGAAIGLVGGAIAIWHAFNPANAPDLVGYALLAPAALLIPLWLHWQLQRRRWKG
ncbi:hypothetical protein [Stutzerimonas tarimensis]|uniref:Transmembrane protein n=1 Tax=Stutzerimonas tarimensis TaxID=1507735 RepID=A0ABV7T1D6_9GAMM